MKKVLMTFVAIAAVNIALADSYTYLTLVEQDGTKTSLTAVGLTITFADGNLVATNETTSESKTIALSSLASLNFSTTQETTTGINTLEKEDFSLSEADAIYDLNGRQIPVGNSLPKGIYIIKKDNATHKIHIR